MRDSRESGTYPSQQKLTLFARKGVAMSLAISREAFLLPVDAEE
jgi:hypothetical protein